MDIREILRTCEKDALIESIIELSEHYYPLDLFLLRSNYEFTTGELSDVWKRVYMAAS